jgi:organic radical activating enzyme
MKRQRPDVKKIVADKTLYIWGAMIVGQGVCRALERHHIKVSGFIDSSQSLQGHSALGYPISSPQSILKNSKERQVILISSGHYDLEIEKICQDTGLKKNSHYIMSYELNDVDPSVDISGTCNLRCISCPRGNFKHHANVGFMSAAEYRPVLEKLLKELPFLGSIQLYTWGEPLLNTNLPEIIKITREAKVLTALSSNLNVGKGYKDVISAKLDWFKISASGYEKSYEVTHTGGKWSKFLSNLYKVAELREQYNPDMQVLLNYHLYKHNIGEDYRKMRALCDELSFIFRPSPAYLYPLENVRDYVDGKPLSPQAVKTTELLLMGLDEGLEKARQRKNNRCPEERCLPITWDRKVRFCGVYYTPYICDDFLGTPVADILRTRGGSIFCQECKKRGLHQFTGVYLSEKIIPPEREVP